MYNRVNYEKIKFVEAMLKKYFVLESAIYEVVSELLENIEGNKHLKITFHKLFDNGWCSLIT